MQKDRKSGIELAPLPRERIGPFLLLGVAKDSDPEQIESRWAQCVLWARQGKTSIPLGDIHWAREVLRDPERRLLADAESLNSDLASRELKRLAEQYRLDSTVPAWTPIDPEPIASDAGAAPDPESVRPSIPAPEVPIELPGVARWLDEQSCTPLDPWSIALPDPLPQGPPHG
jgi:hypothetical protein